MGMMDSKIAKDADITTPPVDGDESAVAAAASQLAVGLKPGDTDARVTRHVFMPGLGLHGTRIDWSSSDASVVSNYGIVHRRSYGDVSVALTATIRRGDAAATKSFLLTVAAQEPEDDPIF
ncbi:immunoglobulin-like domain-containing protein [Paenibacillus cymbidii]|uniref:immunoglobulin-like domain-containing protein n=1 Tax=Paenibacillus cymbidii TaxID=1639034 RepID=UPI001080159D|nr:immunoglobulin-like domain-containing protein [Paenibacillus cymbidii]